MVRMEAVAGVGGLERCVVQTYYHYENASHNRIYPTLSPSLSETR
jgi:hypothetical protein